MLRFWRDHSLTIVLFGIGAMLVGISIPFREGTTFDIVSGIGIAFFTVAAMNMLAGSLREKNKPED